MPWVRIDNTHKLKNDGKGGPSEPENAVCRRIYGEDGKLWPRLLISIFIRQGRYPDYAPEGITISYSINKDKRKSWWDSYTASLTPELIPELIDMLEEAKVELEKSIALHGTEEDK